MSIISKTVEAVKALLEKPLTIPDYQRPYKWQPSHVNQLFDDLLRHRHKNSYRLGTVVLHRDPDSDVPEQAIVDGQQRLLTLTLLCSVMDKDRRQCRPWLLEQGFSAPVTIRNLQHNMAILGSRVNQLSEIDREELTDFLLHKCQLICVVLDNLSEAFQFFDSQNARGKELAPHDLLKAFHLREMADNTEQERLACVATWEDEVSPDGNTPSLHTIMGDYLFRLRRWTSGQSGVRFTRSEIDVFKGASLRESPYRYTDSLRALDYMVDHYNADKTRYWDRQQMVYPFQVDQLMPNGKRFFEYIRHYIRNFEQLFVQPKPELSALLSVINSYKGRNRTGDHYVRNLFYCAVLYYYDKFGDAELKKAAELCFFWSYRIRLAQNRVEVKSIDNPAMSSQGLLIAIKRALHPHEVLAFSVEPLAEREVKGTNVDGLIEEFKTKGYLQ